MITITDDCISKLLYIVYKHFQNCVSINLDHKIRETSIRWSQAECCITTIIVKAPLQVTTIC